MVRVHPEHRRARLLDRIDSAVFWTFVGVVIGVIWLLLSDWSSFS